MYAQKVGEKWRPDWYSNRERTGFAPLLRHCGNAETGPRSPWNPSLRNNLANLSCAISCT